MKSKMKSPQLRLPHAKKMLRNICNCTVGTFSSPRCLLLSAVGMHHNFPRMYFSTWSRTLAVSRNYSPCSFGWLGPSCLSRFGCSATSTNHSNRGWPDHTNPAGSRTTAKFCIILQEVWSLLHCHLWQLLVLEPIINRRSKKWPSSLTCAICVSLNRRRTHGEQACGNQMWYLTWSTVRFQFLWLQRDSRRKSNDECGHQTKESSEIYLTSPPASSKGVRWLCH